MAAVSQKIRAGLIELRTNAGSLYVKPSLYECLYLLWLFRNFRSLPRQVLGRRQRQLIDRLSEAAVSERPTATCIIGVVENAYLPPKPKTEGGTVPAKLVEFTAARSEVIEARAAVSGGTSIQRSRLREETEGARPTPVPKKVEPISASKKQALPHKELERQTAGGAAGVPIRRLQWVMVAVCAAVGLGMLLHSRRVPIHFFTTSAAGTTERQPVFPSASSEPVKPPETSSSQSVVAAAVTPAAAITTLKPVKPPAAMRPVSQHRDPATTGPPVAAATSQERVQVEEAPDNGFSYPVVSSPALSGRVNLRAVIGADGTVKDVDVVSGNRVLAAAAVRAVKHWRYRPHEINGHAAEAETNIAIHFVGDDAVSISFPQR